MIDLIIEEYIASLREKDELDFLFSDLLKLDGYSVRNLPKTGERQYGVDLLAEKNDELFLYVIKQGNLTRGTWDTGVNSVRQSMNQIFDSYLHFMIGSNDLEKKKNIIFVTNGLISDAVRSDWEGYKKHHTTDKINFSEVLLPDLDNLVKKLGFNETLFNKNMHSNLRKCLYFLDEVDYKTDYFNLIIDDYFNSLTKISSEKNKKNIQLYVDAY